MPWGNKKNIDDLVTRISNNDSKLTSLCILTSIRSVTTQSCIQLSNALKSNTILTELFLSGHSVGAEGAAAISEALSGSTGNTTLKKLCIGSQTFSDEGVSALATHLSSWNCLQNLDLELKNLGPNGIADLGVALASNTSLKSLTLSRNPLTDQGVDRFLFNAFIAEKEVTNNVEESENKEENVNNNNNNNNRTLERLSLIETQCGPMAIERCAEICSTSTNTLLSLNLNHNIEIGMNAASLFILPKLLRNGCHLQELHLAHCKIGDNGMQLLCQGLATNVHLLTLDVSNNTFGTDGAHSLALAFSKTSLIGGGGSGNGAPNLETLILSGNNIGSSGTIALAKALSSSSSFSTTKSSSSSSSSSSTTTTTTTTTSSSNRKLKVLKLQSCKIGVDGAYAVGLHLHHLVELNVMDCNLMDDGVIGMVNHFSSSSHSSLRNLNLCANNMSDVSGIAVCDAIENVFPLDHNDLPNFFVLGLGANNDLSVGTTLAVELLLRDRKGFQVAMDKGDDGSGQMQRKEDCDESKFNEMLKKFPPSKFNGGK